MPVIVVGADTPVGLDLISGLLETGQEVRAFVTDPTFRGRFQPRGVKVATGDVSDASHVEGACTNVITAVLVTEAASDERDRSFAGSPQEVLAGWVDAVRSAGVHRVIWVDPGEPPPAGVTQEAVVSSALDRASLVSRVIELDEAAEIPSR
jgi:uncharacterized protein YbjT (DUF2867 family)